MGSVGPLMPFCAQADFEAWLIESCSTQGITVAVTDSQTISSVRALLAVPLTGAQARPRAETRLRSVSEPPHWTDS